MCYSNTVPEAKRPRRMRRDLARLDDTSVNMPVELRAGRARNKAAATERRRPPLTVADLRRWAIFAEHAGPHLPVHLRKEAARLRTEALALIVEAEAKPPRQARGPSVQLRLDWPCGRSETVVGLAAAAERLGRKATSISVMLAKGRGTCRFPKAHEGHADHVVLTRLGTDDAS